MARDRGYRMTEQGGFIVVEIGGKRARYPMSMVSRIED